MNSAKILTFAKSHLIHLTTLLTVLVAAFLFLSVIPNQTRPAQAAACGLGSTTVVAGSAIGIGYNGFAAGESVQLVPQGSFSGPSVATTQDSLAGSVLQNITIPAAQAAGTYNFVIVTRFPITQTICTGGPFTVTAAGGGPCTYSFAPASVAPGAQVTVTIVSGTSGHQFFASINPGGSSLSITSTGNILLPAPTTAGSYTVAARDNTTSTLCGLVAGSPTLTVTGGVGGSCTYNFAPISVAGGGTVTITIVTAPAADTIEGGISNGTIIVKNTRTGPGTITLAAPASGTGFVVYATDTTTAPPTLCALTSGTSTLTITGGTTTSALCATSSITDEPTLINVMNKCIIGANNYDDKAFVKNNVMGLVDGLSTALTGFSRLNPEVNPVLAGTGALAASGRLVLALYTPPASGVMYFAEQFHKLNPVQPAFAQSTGGIGFDALKPVQSIWSAFRNISYIGFIIIFVIVGFMIMFRAHISPQAVATIQDSVPRIVVAIILVTFSYAIAGLMIDLMFLFLNIAVSALQATGLLKLGGADYVFKDNVFTVIVTNWPAVVGKVFEVVRGALDNVINLPIGIDKLISLFGGGIAGIVFGIAMLFIMFRIFFMLLMAYVSIILLTISAPFFFLLQALPGNNSATTWFKQLASNIAVFPTVALMFIMAGIMSGVGNLGGSGTGPITQGTAGQFPLFTGNLDPALIGNIIGLGLLIMTPEAANLVKQAFGVKGGPQLGGAGTAALAGAGAFLGRRAAESAPVRAVQGISKLRGEERMADIANAAPRFIRGGGKVETRLGTLQRIAENKEGN